MTCPITHHDLHLTLLLGAYAANTPTAVTNATADMALFLTLAVLRNTSQVEANCRSGRWRDGLELNEDPFGKTFGIFGMGKIAKATAKKVQGTGMKVIYNSRTKLSDEEEKTLDVSYVTEDELLTSSDVLSLHCPLTPETRQWFNAERIAKLKDGAFFVNVRHFIPLSLVQILTCHIDRSWCYCR